MEITSEVIVFTIITGLITGLLTGVISGIVASLCYAGIKKVISPKIKVDPEVIVHPKDKLILVKIINRGALVNEIKADLTYYHSELTNCFSRKLEPSKPIPFIVDKFVDDADDHNSQSSYAVILGFEYKDVEFVNEENFESAIGDRIVFSFRAAHSFSGTIKYFNQEFHCGYNDEVKIGDDLIFNRGNNTGVQKASGRI